ncbi:MAG: c-type cytochrome domain-containing protein [Fimbriimonas sp.]
MNTKKLTFVLAALVAISVLPGFASPQGKPKTPKTPKAPAYKAVQAILTKNCVKCHAGAQPAEGLVLTDYDSVMKGGHDGPVVKAGDVKASLLARVLRSTTKLMPPGQPLVEADIKTIEAWITAGAKK